MATLLDLPVELLVSVAALLRRRTDLSSLCRCSKALHFLFGDDLFRLAFEHYAARKHPQRIFTAIFVHATKTNSQAVMVWLAFHELSHVLNELIPLRAGDKKLTYLHFAILRDAPSVAAQLVKNGADIGEGENDYPDLTPLYLAVAQQQHSTVDALDTTLRIACSYALPRTATYLLARGANPNKLSAFGTAAMHLAVMPRMPWRHFHQIVANKGRSEGNQGLWKHSVHLTVSVLLDFGGDPNLESIVSRTHPCGHGCLRSVDCSRPGQRVLHFAASSGNEAAVSSLLSCGADPNLYDAEGYCPTYGALAHGHSKIVLQLLQLVKEPESRLVVLSSKSTAMHIACRFASAKVVRFLLRLDLDPNARDAHDQTPLHEVIGQKNAEALPAVLQTIYLLESYGASADCAAVHGKTARQLGKEHEHPSVRELFDSDDDSPQGQFFWTIKKGRSGTESAP